MGSVSLDELSHPVANLTSIPSTTPDPPTSTYEPEHKLPFPRASPGSRNSEPVIPETSVTSGHSNLKLTSTKLIPQKNLKINTSGPVLSTSEGETSRLKTSEVANSKTIVLTGRSQSGKSAQPSSMYKHQNAEGIVNFAAVSGQKYYSYFNHTLETEPVTSKMKTNNSRRISQ